MVESADPRQAEAKEAIAGMWSNMKELGKGYDLVKAKKHLKGTVALYKDNKFFEIPNRGAVFEVILNVAKEKHQRANLLEKVRDARADIKYLGEKDVNIDPVQDIFEDITEYMRDKEYEMARIKFLELELQVTMAKKALGEDVGANPLADPKVKRVIISDEGGSEVEPLMELDEITDDAEEDPDDVEWEEELKELDILEEAVDEDDHKDEEDEDIKNEDEDSDSGLVWEDD